MRGVMWTSCGISMSGDLALPRRRWRSRRSDRASAEARDGQGADAQRVAEGGGEVSKS